MKELMYAPKVGFAAQSYINTHLVARSNSQTVVIACTYVMFGSKLTRRVIDKTASGVITDAMIRNTIKQIEDDTFNGEDPLVNMYISDDLLGQFIIYFGASLEQWLSDSEDFSDLLSKAYAKRFCRLKLNIERATYSYMFGHNEIYNEQRAIIDVPNDGEILLPRIKKYVDKELARNNIALFHDKQEPVVLTSQWSDNNQADFTDAMTQVPEWFN